ncbi:MAG: TonB-dependent receptor [Myxococcales bacterium]|nr:TonB-dependent receptor [Myxococcales bacterium]
MLLLLLAGAARAQMPEIDPIEEEPAPRAEQAPVEQAPVILEEFNVDARNVVLSAARTRTTIQEAPGIITVITAEEIRARGHRTVLDVLRTVPGFEARRDSNGWFDEGTARGQPRTVLVLINGINVLEPLRNALSLDRKIPIDSVKRIEVTSGPGGVLWGSNALLGIVNIILKDAEDLSGLEVTLGGGHGPGAQQAAKGRLAYGDRFLDDDLKLYLAVDFYTDKGAELEVDARKVLGALPAPELDGKTLFQNEPGVTDYNSRDWWLSTTFNVSLFDKLTLDGLLEFERDYRQIATGVAILKGDEDLPDGTTRPVTDETQGNDAIQLIGLGFRDRFLGDRFGLSARAYGVHFTLNEDPFWVFPRRGLGNITALDKGVVISLNGDVWRVGGNVDADLQLGQSHHLVFGGEVFSEIVRDSHRGDILRRPVHIPGLAEAGADDPGVARGIFGPARCPPAGRRLVKVGERLVPVEFGDGCTFDETLVLDTTRTVGALYLSDEWKPARQVAIQPGFRVQVSDAYDPVALLGGAFVWNLTGKTFFKLNYAEGFRPPELQSTVLNAETISSVTFVPDPDLDVERSQAAEAEINTVLFENQGVLKGVYLRGDYAYTLISDLVRNVSGRFVNSGKRGIHSAEFLTRVDFSGGHEVWLGGHFVRAEDSVFGPVRNFPNYVLMGGGRARLFNGHLELSALGTLVGAQEDLNRAPDAGDVLIPGFTAVDATDVEAEKVDPVFLLRLGFRVLNLWEDRLELSGFVYNALDQRWLEPDFFFEDRVQIRGQPREGMSAFGQATVRFF